MRKIGLAASALLFLSIGPSTRAQQVCPCVPITYQWVTVACDSWQCVETEIALANGATIIPMPTNSSDFRWVVLKRIVAGSAVVSPNQPFTVDGFDGLQDGVSKYFATEHELRPMLVTSPDGKVLVVARSAPEKPRARVVAH